MAASTSVFGTRGQPTFPATDAPDLGADEGILADYAAAVGTRRVGTTAERLDLVSPQRFGGLLWGDTSTGIEYKYTSAGWIAIARLDSAGVVTLASGVTAASVEVVRSGNIIYANVRDAQRTAAWTPGAVVATITASMAPTNPAVISALEGATGVSKGAIVNASGQMLIFETTNSGTAGRVSITGTWAVAP